MPRHRRSFTPQYRAKATHMVIDEHRRVAEVAREIDVNKNLLYTWVRDEQWRMAEARQATARHTEFDDGQPLSTKDRAELVQLQATVARPAIQIAFLNEVSACFAAAVQAHPLELIAGWPRTSDIPPWGTGRIAAS
jgi:transposase